MSIFFHTKGLTLEDAERVGTDLAEEQRAMNWKIGDLAIHAKDVLKLGDNYSQVFPEWMSVGLIQRCEAVARAYPTEESRNILATWTQHMTVANKPNRIELVTEMVSKGETSDESRKYDKQSDRPRWILCVDVNYFLHRFWFSGAGVESAVSVANWVQRTVERLREKGLTDVACCFDSKVNHRKELTKEWDDRYKDRPPKDPELSQQLSLVFELLSRGNRTDPGETYVNDADADESITTTKQGRGLCCVLIEGMEADDCMASYAKQFPGRVTLLSQDKDLKQCLSDKCNMLLDIEFIEDETSGEHLPSYKWLTAKSHTEETGIKPEQWIDFQCLMGDNVDGIRGAEGIGKKGAADMVQQFGTVEAVIQAAKDGDEWFKPKQRESLIAFEEKMDVTRRLVTLVDDLTVPETTQI